MAVLSNQPVSDPSNWSTETSYGPFIAIDHGRFLFDTRVRKMPIWTGHAASANGGVLQHPECWSGNWSDEMLRIKQAYGRLFDRTRSRFCGAVRMRLLESPDSGATTICHPATMVYQYIALSILDQFESSHRQVAESIVQNCGELCDSFGYLFENSFSDGANFEFGFELKDHGESVKFRAALTMAGIHIQPVAPDRLPNRIVFALNLAYRNHLPLFWRRLKLAFENFQNDAFTYPVVQVDDSTDLLPFLEFQRALQTAQRERKAPEEFKAISHLQTGLERSGLSLETQIVDANNYELFRERILQMQTEVYEPARRTPPEEFDMLFESDRPLAIVLLDGEKIAAMVFAGMLKLFIAERGVATDPFLDDPSVYYSMDLTVAEDYRGGTGRLMKQALVMLAIDNGVTAIHGRNRDRLAAGMWAINLSLGSYELQHLPDDYPDDQEFRDCIYYRCPLTWDAKTAERFPEDFPNRKYLDGTGIGIPESFEAPDS